VASGVAGAVPGWVRAGVVVQVGAAAAVQFAGGRGFAFRAIRRHDWATCVGDAWLDGYQVDAAGEAVERRSIFVLIDGLFPAPAPQRPTGVARRPGGRRSGTDAEPPS
jgi:hypothetical protein